MSTEQYFDTHNSQGIVYNAVKSGLVCERDPTALYKVKPLPSWTISCSFVQNLRGHNPFTHNQTAS